MIQLIDDAIKNEPENNIMWWEIIADGYNETVDKYRNTIDNANTWLAQYQSELSETYKISNLKIKHTGASGYFIEIPKSQTIKIPSFFTHKQTLVNAARYGTPELQEFEERILEAQNNKASKEYEIFLNIREEILGHFNEIKRAWDITAYIDFIAGLSEVAYQNNYHKPDMNDAYNLEIHAGRHPVIENGQWDFISNDLSLTKEEYVHIITGPNMWWKSTFLRQNALIILMAHIGSFVPARSANIPLTDKIFSRVGASDNLFLWQSTFMVEMQEVAHILNNSTKKSFVIMDEIGRGTATYDGMSLAWAILKYNHQKIQAKTLFATHYHELIDEASVLSWVKNFSVAVWENEENLVFLRKVIPGWMKKSFGLEVARIAWIKDEVIHSAREMLSTLERHHYQNSQLSFDGLSQKTEIIEKIIVQESPLEKKLKELNLDSLTPLQALNQLHEFKSSIR